MANWTQYVLLTIQENLNKNWKQHCVGSANLL